MKSIKFQLCILTVRHMYIYTVCSPPIVRFLSVTTYLIPFIHFILPLPLYLTSFTQSTSPLFSPLYPLVATSLLSMSMSLCLSVLFVAFRFISYISMISCDFQLFLSGLFHLAWLSRRNDFSFRNNLCIRKKYLICHQS